MSETPIPSAAPQPSVVAVADEIQTLEHVDHYLYIGQQSCASDIHLSVNSRPVWRRNGQLEPIWLKAPFLSAADTERLAMGFLNDEQ